MTGRRRLSLLTFALGAVAAGAVAVAILAIGAPKATSTTRVRMVTVSDGVVQSTVSGSGSLQPVHEASASFAASGRITAVDVHVGEHVAQGQLLATVDPTSAQASLAQAQASLQSADDELAAAQAPATTTTGATPSRARGGSAQKAVQSSSPAVSVASAQAAVDSATLQIREAEDNVAATRLVAPIGGTVAAISGAVGDAVGSGGGAGGASGAQAGSGASGSGSAGGLVTIADVSRFQMIVALTESDIGKVRPGQAATVTVNAASGEQFAAHVSSVGLLASTSSSSSGGGSSGAVSYPVTLTLDQTDPALKAGMSASAQIVVAQAGGLSVPNQALSGSTLTVSSGGRQSTRQVVTGLAGDTSTQILSGLKAGEQVVVRSVTVTPATASATAGAGFGGGRLGRAFGGGGFGGRFFGGGGGGG